MSALTEKQVDYLRRCAEAPQSSWDAGSTTVSVLKRRGFIEPCTKGNKITEAGRAYLTAFGEVRS